MLYSMRFFAACFAFLVLADSAFAETPKMVPPEMQQQIIKQMQHIQSLKPEEQAAYIQKMRDNTLKIENCMNENGGAAAMEELHKKSEQLKITIGALCADGKRDEAQAAAIESSKEMAADPRIQKIRDCSANMPEQMPSAETMDIPTEQYSETHHVCDSQGTKNGL